MNLSLSRRRFLSLAAGSVAAASTTGPWSTHRNRFAYGSVGSSMQAGAAKVSIDPPSFPVFVNGGFRARTVEKIVDPLFARCLVLDEGTTQIAIGTVDNCVVPRELFDRAKAIAARSTGIPRRTSFFRPRTPIPRRRSPPVWERPVRTITPSGSRSASPKRLRRPKSDCNRPESDGRRTKTPPTSTVGVFS